MLSGGILEADTSTGTLVNSVEGDNYNLGGSDTDVETIATSLGQQLNAFINNSRYRIVVSVHYYGGATIQQLSKGGLYAQYGFDDGIAAVQRVKALSDSAGWNYQTHMIWLHGGSGVNPYGTALENFISDWRADIASSYTGTSNVFSMQQRAVGNPDYSIQQANINSTNFHLLGSYDQLCEGAGDNIHLSNHGTRNAAMYFAKGAYDVLFGSFTEFLEIGTITYDNVDTITMSVLNSEGALSIETNPTVEIGGSPATGTWTVNGTNLEFQITSSIPTGLNTVDIIGGDIRDSRPNMGIIFNDALASPYEINKGLIRNDYSASVDFGVGVGSGRILMNFAKSSTMPTPDANGNYWNDMLSGNPPINYANDDFEPYVFGGLVDTNNNASGLSFTKIASFDNNFGDLSGSNNTGATVNVGDYLTPASTESWFANGQTAQWDFSGLDSGKTYTFKFWGSRNSAGNRFIEIDTQVSFATSQNFNAALNTDPDDNVEIIVSGQTSVSFYLRVLAGSTFGYVGVVDIDIS